jgi:hypothetical protein
MKSKTPSFSKRPIPPRNKVSAAGGAKPAQITYMTPEYKTAIVDAAYIGQKGYTIPKTALHPADLVQLKKDLFMTPKMNMMVAGAGTTETTSFPIYRENTAKIYIPRFYGIERYGLPPRTDIQQGTPIHLAFTKELRDYQTNIIQTYMTHVDTPVATGSAIRGNGAILEVPCGRGKCLARDTKILMYDGTIKAVQDVIQGDLLMGDDSTPRRVLSLARGREMMYRIKPKSGEGYTVNESHILSLKNIANTVFDIPLTTYMKMTRHERSQLYGYRVPVVFRKNEPPTLLEIDPYLFGYQLADTEFPSEAIPHKYKCSTRAQQFELLAGIIDAIGQYYNDGYKIMHGSSQWMDDVVFVARSLGVYAHKSCMKIAHKPNIYTVTLRGRGIQNIQVRSLSKAVPEDTPQHDILKYSFLVMSTQIDEYFGFEIDGNHRFLLGDFTVTHNTVMALKIISEIRLKTLILVHKEFLMNQWIERIAEFLEGARVGKIQGPLFDIEDKDIVIGMIQTMHSRDFAPSAFESFGLTIIDEVHRIGSEEFSKSLFKTITPYMLGISATVDRKDNMTDILYKFIGPKIYSEERAKDDPVCVRAIEYRSNNDTLFDATEYDYRGMPKYSSMIKKVSEYGPRSDFIVRVLSDLLQENPQNQIMILGHNRSLLEYLHAAVGHRLPNTTVGYYVGGMKQADLQETEGRQIVLATYAMAAEALDIKTLSTLIMATPKTDIEQSIGRILRVKHAQPIVVDIVDSHELFKRQFQQRKMFYRKCQYDIFWTSSNRYTNMFQSDWKNPDSRVWTADKSRFSNKNATPNGRNNEIIGKGVCLVPKEIADMMDEYKDP